MSDEAVNNKIPEALGDWSKWIIGINFSAATGCIVAIDQISPRYPWPGILFVIAILCFALNVFVAVRFTLRLALYTSLSPREYRKTGTLQLRLFFIGLLSVLLWLFQNVIKKSIPKQEKQTTQLVSKIKITGIKIQNKPDNALIQWSSQ